MVMVMVLVIMVVQFTGAVQSTLDGALAADTNGNNGSATQIRLASTTGFSIRRWNFIAVGNELITYTGQQHWYRTNRYF